MIKLLLFIEYIQTNIWALQTCSPKREENPGCQSSDRGGASFCWQIQRTGNFYSRFFYAWVSARLSLSLSYQWTVDHKKLGREIELTLTCGIAPGRWSGGRNKSGLRTQTTITVWPRWSQWAGRVANSRSQPSSAQKFMKFQNKNLKSSYDIPKFTVVH